MADWTPVGDVPELRPHVPLTSDSSYANAASADQAPSTSDVAAPVFPEGLFGNAAVEPGRVAARRMDPIVSHPDLFSKAHQFGGDEYVSSPSADMSSSQVPLPKAHFSAERNETSVLFTLDALKGPGKGPPLPFGGGASSRDDETSGLADLRSLTASSSAPGPNVPFRSTLEASVCQPVCRSFVPNLPTEPEPPLPEPAGLGFEPFRLPEPRPPRTANHHRRGIVGALVSTATPPSNRGDTSGSRYRHPPPPSPPPQPRSNNAQPQRPNRPKPPQPLPQRRPHRTPPRRHRRNRQAMDKARPPNRSNRSSPSRMSRSRIRNRR
jgi:hypothetical protein